tara:strand:+ start:171 stop:398 length:228 start_codon:yes stop_codon:yes gene_type:complete
MKKLTRIEAIDFISRKFEGLDQEFLSVVEQNEIGAYIYWYIRCLPESGKTETDLNLFWVTVEHSNNYLSKTDTQF